ARPSVDITRAARHHPQRSLVQCIIVTSLLTVSASCSTSSTGAPATGCRRSNATSPRNWGSVGTRLTNYSPGLGGRWGRPTFRLCRCPRAADRPPYRSLRFRPYQIAEGRLQEESSERRDAGAAGA